MSQLLTVLLPIVISTLVGLVIRAHALGVVIAAIRGWTWLITLPEPPVLRAELRATIAGHVDQQKSHYLNDLKLGPAEVAVRLLEWQFASVAGDIVAALFALARRFTRTSARFSGRAQLRFAIWLMSASRSMQNPIITRFARAVAVHELLRR